QCLRKSERSLSMSRPTPNPSQEGSRHPSASYPFPSQEGLGVRSWSRCMHKSEWSLSMKLSQTNPSLPPPRSGTGHAVRLHFWCVLVLWCAGLCHSARAANAPQPPPGWRMELVAEAPDAPHPTVMCVGPDGQVFVVEDPMYISTSHADADEGRILCLHPCGRRTLFAQKL